MASLPNNTFASPGNPYYALVDTSGPAQPASSLQSPASIIPDGAGNIQLDLIATAGDSQIQVEAQGAADGASIIIESQGGIASLGLLGGTAFGSVINMTGITPGGKTAVIQQSGAAPYLFTMAAAPAQVNQSPFLNYNPTAGVLILGDNLPTGSVSLQAPLIVRAAPSNGNAVQIQSTSATTANIFNTVADAGGLLFGSSAACPATLAVADTAGVGTQFVAVGNGIGTTNLRLQGGSTAQPIPIVNTSAASAGALNIGPSVINQGLIALTDTGTTPNQGGVVTVNGNATVTGTLTTDDITLTGVSSTIQVPGQGGVGQPPVGINMSLSQTLVGNLELAATIPGSYNGGIVGQSSSNFNINSTGQPAGVIGNTGAQVGGPAALGDIGYEGLYIVSLVCSNASTDIYSKLAQIRTVSYWNPTTGWFGGSGGYSSAGGAEYRAGINPSNVIAAGQLWVTNTSGNNWTGMTTNLTQITGVIPGYFVA